MPVTFRTIVSVRDSARRQVFVAHVTKRHVETDGPWMRQHPRSKGNAGGLQPRTGRPAHEIQLLNELPQEMAKNRAPDRPTTILLKGEGADRSKRNKRRRRKMSGSVLRYSPEERDRRRVAKRQRYVQEIITKLRYLHVRGDLQSLAERIYERACAEDSARQAEDYRTGREVTELHLWLERAESMCDEGNRTEPMPTKPEPQPAKKRRRRRRGKRRNQSR